MKIKLVLPKSKEGLVALRPFRMPPLGLLRLASLTPKNVDIEFTDENYKEINYENTDLAAISSLTHTVNRAYMIADEFRRKNVKVILGGVHVSLMYEEAIKHADSVVIGEADLIWPQIIKDFKNKSLKKFYWCKTPDPLDVLEIRKDLLDSYPRGKQNLIQTTRGCPFNCDFCSVSKFNGTKPRHYPLGEVINQIENYKKESKGLMKPMIIFYDDNIAANVKYAERLFEALKEFDVYWTSQSSITIAQNEKLLKLAKESGCISLFIGFETISQESLDEVHKSYKVGDYEKSIERIQDCGIILVGAFIFGFDSDKRNVFDETVDFAIKNKINAVQFSILTPFPGTRLFEKLKKEKRIFDFNWDNYDAAHCVFKPKNMNPEELQMGCIRAYKDFYSTSSTLKRFLPVVSKLSPISSLSFLSLNLGFRKKEFMNTFFNF